MALYKTNSGFKTLNGSTPEMVLPSSDDRVFAWFQNNEALGGIAMSMRGGDNFEQTGPQLDPRGHLVIDGEASRAAFAFQAASGTPIVRYLEVRRVA